jgi:hypothetical protein
MRRQRSRDGWWPQRRRRIRAGRELQLHSCYLYCASDTHYLSRPPRFKYERDRRGSSTSTDSRGRRKDGKATGRAAADIEEDGESVYSDSEEEEKKP